MYKIKFLKDYRSFLKDQIWYVGAEKIYLSVAESVSVFDLAKQGIISVESSRFLDPIIPTTNTSTSSNSNTFTKKDIIERLFHDGHISFSEMWILITDSTDYHILK